MRMFVEVNAHITNVMSLTARATRDLAALLDANITASRRSPQRWRRQ